MAMLWKYIKALVPHTSKSVLWYVKVGVVLFLHFFKDLFLNIGFDRIGLVFDIVFWYLIVNIVFNYLRVLVVELYLNHYGYDGSHYDNYIVGVNSVSLFLTHLVYFFVFLHLVGVQFFDFLTGLSLVAVATVLIFKDYISNFLNGITMMFSHTIRIGDFVKIGDVKGRVRDFTLLFVEVETDTGDVCYVPNMNMMVKDVVNYSVKDVKKITVEVCLDKASLKSLDTLEENVIEDVRTLSRVDDVTMVFKRFEKDNTVVEFIVETQKYTFSLEKDVKEKIGRHVKKVVDDIEEKK